LNDIKPKIVMLQKHLRFKQYKFQEEISNINYPFKDKYINISYPLLLACCNQHLWKLYTFNNIFLVFL